MRRTIPHRWTRRHNENLLLLSGQEMWRRTALTNDSADALEAAAQASTAFSFPVSARFANAPPLACEGRNVSLGRDGATRHKDAGRPTGGSPALARSAFGEGLRRGFAHRAIEQSLLAFREDDLLPGAADERAQIPSPAPPGTLRCQFRGIGDARQP